MRLKEYLKLSGFTQQEFANLSGIAGQRVSDYVNGVCDPSKLRIKKIEEITEGLVSYNDWYIEEKKTPLDRLREGVKECKLRYKKIGEMIGCSSSYASEKIRDGNLTRPELERILQEIDRIRRATIKSNPKIKVVIEEKKERKPRKSSIMVLLERNKMPKGTIGILLGKSGATASNKISGKTPFTNYERKKVKAFFDESINSKDAKAWSEEYDAR